MQHFPISLFCVSVVVIEHFKNKLPVDKRIRFSILAIQSPGCPSVLFITIRNSSPDRIKVYIQRRG